MKKRLFSLFLCLVTVLALVLTGCSEQTDKDIEGSIAEKEAENTMTLTMWVVTEEKVDDAVAAEVSDAINSVTQVDKVKLVIKYFTEDEYRNTLYHTINAYKETYSKEDEKVSDKLTVDEDGLITEIYPALQENQVDIVYIGDLHKADGSLLTSGADMYREMVDNGWLASMNSALNSATAKKILEAVSPTLVNAAKYKGGIYAIPNNNILGNYTYMLLNEELLNACRLQGHLESGNIDGFYNRYVYQFINMVLESGDTSILPVDATYEECLEMLAYNWSVDPETLAIDGNKFSAFGSLASVYNSAQRGKDAFKVESLFTNRDFTSAYLQLNKYRLSGNTVFADESNTEYAKSAVKFIQGDLSLVSVEDKVAYYTDEDGVRYYAVPVAAPSVTDEDVFGGMFGVCAFNTDKKIARCMEIITRFNTDAELRNLLQYGVEGEHYHLVDGAPVRTNSGEKYKMNIYATGNAFLTYPESWMSADIWEMGMQQNRDAVVAPTFGFDLAAYEDVEKLLDTDLLETINTINQRVSEAIASCTTYAELETLVSDLAIILNPAKAATMDDLTGDIAKNAVTEEELTLIYNAVRHYTSSKTMVDILNEENGSATEDASKLYSPYGIYYKWAVENAFVSK